MIIPVTKEFFKQHIGTTTAKDIGGIPEYVKNEMMFPFLYDSETGICILWVYELRKCYVYGEGLERKDITLPDFSSWKLECVSATPNPVYIKNITQFCDGSVYSSEKRKPILITGDWKLSCPITGEEIEFTMHTNDTKDYLGLDGDGFIGFPEKLEFPRNLRKIREKTKIINYLIYQTYGPR